MRPCPLAQNYGDGDATVHRTSERAMEPSSVQVLLMHETTYGLSYDQRSPYSHSKILVNRRPLQTP